MSTRTTGRWWIPSASVVLVCSSLVGVMIGPAGPQWWRVPLELLNRLPLISIHSGLTATDWSIVWQIRAPRVVLAAIVGSTLSIAGASYQGVFRNPLVDPYLLGVAAGAGLGATIVITVNRSGTSTWWIDPLPLVAFLGGLTAVFVTYMVGITGKGERSSTSLVLAGVAVTSLATALQTFLLQRNTDVVRQVYSWILGRLSSATWGDVRLVLPYVLVSTVTLLLHRRLLDVLRVGDDEAAALGVNVNRVRLVVVIAATFGTAAVVAVSGLIGFVGIIVPHAVRLVVGTSYRIVLPVSLLFGAAFLILADIPGRVLDNPAETPIGVVTAFLGAPFFLLILRSRRRER
ncbi:MAG: iron chelate uptake ABC transporter family permease subunit [Actinobacteria bacterium]|nr:iron chelate uptake ABC transporter family permease subunit [Actinomycetota bacterium]MSZ96232.1 iron chelate uptake ABC transporter family permease subunit [Actinomycetota bacterium]